MRQSDGDPFNPNLLQLIQCSTEKFPKEIPPEDTQVRQRELLQDDIPDPEDNPTNRAPHNASLTQSQDPIDDPLENIQLPPVIQPPAIDNNT